MLDVFIINGKDKQTVVSQMESYRSKIDSSTPSIPHKQNDVELKGMTARRGSHVMFSDNQVQWNLTDKYLFLYNTPSLFLYA